MRKRKIFSDYLINKFNAVFYDFSNEEYEFYKRMIAMNTIRDEEIENNNIDDFNSFIKNKVEKSIFFIEVLQFTIDSVEYKVIVDYNKNFVCTQSISRIKIIKNKITLDIEKTFYSI